MRALSGLLEPDAVRAARPVLRGPLHPRGARATRLPGSLSDILAEARAYRLSLVLAHQHLSQLPKDLRDAVSADARNKVYFTVSPEDGAELAKHVAPLLGAHDLSHLGAYQAAGRIVVESRQAPAFTFRTRPLPALIRGRADQVRAASRNRFTTRKPGGGGRTRKPFTDPRGDDTA